MDARDDPLIECAAMNLRIYFQGGKENGNESKSKSGDKSRA